ncbi:MAG: hypothetical protein EP343_16480 [Deltaproteobacteria bacterium]|nr:MAG: hypothetical protein EP343_16480 [Deltaproteobacteria bacterium]
MKSRWFGLITAFLAYGFTAVMATKAWATKPQGCNTFLSKGQHLQAIACYEKLVQAMKPPHQLSLLDKKEKSLYYKKISYSYRQLARSQTTEDGKSYCYEKAAEYLAKVHEEKLCGKPVRCRLVRGQEAEVRKKIRYANLTLVHSNGETLTVVIKGYKYNEAGKGAVLVQTKNYKLRPGTYTVTSIPKGKGKKRQEKVVKLNPDSTQSITLTKLVVVRSRKVSKTGSYVLMGVGASLFVIGTVGVVAGYVMQSSANSAATAENDERNIRNFLDNPGTTPTTQTLDDWKDLSASIDSEYNTGSTLLVASWPVASVGLAGAVAGLVWLGAISGTSGPAKQANVPPSSSIKMIGKKSNLGTTRFHLQVR